MLRIILVIINIFRKEKSSIQREILNRNAQKRPLLDYSNRELLEIYEHLVEVMSYRIKFNRAKISDFHFMIQYPKTALNIINNKALPIEVVENFKKKIEQMKKEHSNRF